MKLLLIRPAPSQIYTTGGPDLGLGFLATAFSKHNVQVRVADQLQKRVFRPNLENLIAEFDPDLIGIKIYSSDVLAAKKLTAWIKQKRPDTKIIVGGPFPSGARENIFEWCSEDIDYSIVGEGECSVAPLISALTSGSGFEKVPGLVWRDDGIHCNEPQYLDDLDQAGLPDFSDMPPSHYPVDIAGMHYIPVMTTRGCPFNCSYCAGKILNGRKLRRRSADMVADDVVVLRDKYHATYFNLVDDNFTCNHEHAMNVCSRLAQRAPEMKWRCTNGLRLDSLDEELLHAMEKAGCIEVYAAIETGSPRIAAEMERETSLQVLIEKVQLIRRVTNFQLLGLFMVGFPSETPAELRQTIRLSLKLPLNRVAFSYFSPLVGTRIFNELRLQDPELGHRPIGSFDQIPRFPRVLSQWQLWFWQKVGYFRFYLRPHIVWGMLRFIRNPESAWRLAKRIATVAFER